MPCHISDHMLAGMVARYEVKKGRLEECEELVYCQSGVADEGTKSSCG